MRSEARHGMRDSDSLSRFMLSKLPYDRNAVRWRIYGFRCSDGDALNIVNRYDGILLIAEEKVAWVIDG